MWTEIQITQNYIDIDYTDRKYTYKIYTSKSYADMDYSDRKLYKFYIENQIILLQGGKTECKLVEGGGVQIVLTKFWQSFGTFFSTRNKLV